jgi:hypothetical protein
LLHDGDGRDVLWLFARLALALLRLRNQSALEHIIMGNGDAQRVVKRPKNWSAKIKNREG